MRDDSNEGRRGLAENSARPRFLVIGRVGRPHGVRGEVRVEVVTDLPERFTWLDKVYVGNEQPRPVAVEGVRFHKSWVLLKLAGYDNRESAASLGSQWLQVPEEEGIPLAEGEYYLFQLIGMTVYSDENERLGVITEVLETGANDIFVVRGERGEILLPDTDEVVTEIDFDKNLMKVHVLPGLIT